MIGVNYYKITISDYNGADPHIISHEFKTADLPEKRKKPKGPRAESIVNKYSYMPTLIKIITDDNHIFAFQYRHNIDGEYLVDVFDGENGEYISSAWFPFIPHDIKKGKAYFCKYHYSQWIRWKMNYVGPNLDQDGFPAIEVYKIDP